MRTHTQTATNSDTHTDKHALMHTPIHHSLCTTQALTEAKTETHTHAICIDVYIDSLKRSFYPIYRACNIASHASNLITSPSPLIADSLLMTP